MICSKCKKEHNGEGLPPSLRGKTVVCYSCYKKVKDKNFKDWYLENKVKINKNRRLKRAADPKKTKEEWLNRTQRWKDKKKLRKLTGKS